MKLTSPAHHFRGMFLVTALLLPSFSHSLQPSSKSPKPSRPLRAQSDEVVPPFGLGGFFGKSAFGNIRFPDVSKLFETELRKNHYNEEGLRLVAPPGPIRWPVLGTLPDFLGRGGLDQFCEIYETMHLEYGSMYRTSLAGREELVVSDPRVMDLALRKEGKYPVGGAEDVTTFEDYYKEKGLQLALNSVSRGPAWKAWRNSLNPDIVGVWDTYLPVIADAARVASTVAGEEVNVGGRGLIDFDIFVSRLAFDMFSAVLYGESPMTVDSHRAKPEDIEFVQNTQKAFDTTGALISDPLAKMRGSELYNDFVVSMDKTFTFATDRTRSFANMVKKEETAATADEMTTTTTTTTSDDRTASGCPVQGVKTAAKSILFGNNRNRSFVERLVQRDHLTVDEISELTGPLLMAGVDTTAYVMSWLFLNLATHPKAQDALHDELSSVLQGADVTTSNLVLEKLPYLRACIRESHRLTPPSPMSIKTLEVDLDVDMGDGTAVRASSGTHISLNLRAIPMDADYVGDEPHQFRPERFLPEAVEARKGTHREILDHPAFADPFGRGKRRCLGANVAVAEIVAATARLVQDWKITLPNNEIRNAVDGVVQTPQWKRVQKLMLKADPYPKLQLVKR